MLCGILYFLKWLNYMQKKYKKFLVIKVIFISLISISIPNWKWKLTHFNEILWHLTISSVRINHALSSYYIGFCQVFNCNKQSARQFIIITFKTRFFFLTSLVIYDTLNTVSTAIQFILISHIILIWGEAKCMHGKLKIIW